MNHELVEKSRKNWFVGLKAKTYNYLIDNDSKYKKAKGIKKYVIKINLNLKIIKTVQKQLNLKIN